MKKLALMAFSLSLAACGGEPPPERQPRQLSVRRTGEATKKPPEGILAPVDAWRGRLDEHVRVPWKLVQVHQQIEAPPGWTRISGPRGLRIDLSNGKETQSFWVMTSDFAARQVEAEPAQPCGKNEEFVIYQPASQAKGWSQTSAVVAALGLSSS